MVGLRALPLRCVAGVAAGSLLMSACTGTVLAPAPTLGGVTPGVPAVLDDGTYILATAPPTGSCEPGRGRLEGESLIIQGALVIVTTAGTVFTGSVVRQGTRFRIRTTPTSGATSSIDLVGSTVVPGRIVGSSRFAGFSSAARRLDCLAPFTGRLATSAAHGSGV